MFQEDDSTVVVINLYGSGFGWNYLNLRSDSTMCIPLQVVGYDSDEGAYILNCSMDTIMVYDEATGTETPMKALVPGCSGLVDEDNHITWGNTYFYYGQDDIKWVFSKNALYFTDGEAFVVPSDAPAFIMGDLNHDEVVDVSDVTALIAVILGDVLDGIDAEAGDVDMDGSLDVADVTAIINFVLTGSWPQAE